MNWAEDSGLPHWYQKIVKWIEPKTQAYHIGTKRLLSELSRRLRLTTLVPEDCYVNWAKDSGLPHWYQKIVKWIEPKTPAYLIGTRRLLSELSRRLRLTTLVPEDCYVNWAEDSGLPHWYQKIVKWIEPKTQAYLIGTRRLLCELSRRLRLTTLVPEDC